MRRCAICNKIWFNLTSPVCEDCYNETKIKVNNLYEEIKYLEELLDKDYLRIVQYLSKYKKLLKLYKELYFYAGIFPKEIEIEPKTYNEFINLVNENISDLVNHRIDVYYIQIEKMGDMTCVVELKILENELLKAQQKYPEFKESLNTTRIENILSKYE